MNIGNTARLLVLLFVPFGTALMKIRLDVISHVDSYLVEIDGTKQTKTPPASSAV